MGILLNLTNLGNFLNSFLFKLFILVDEPHEKIQANIVILIVFAYIYYYLYNIDNDTYSVKKFTYFDAIYFSFVVHFTLGFGDIFPVSTKSRTIVMIHTGLFWLINLMTPDISKFFKIKK